MPRKIDLFLASDLSPRQAATEVTSLQSVLEKALPEGHEMRSIVNDPTALQGLAHGDETAAGPPYVALIEFTVDDTLQIDPIVTAVADVLNEARWIHRTRSSVVAGPEHVFVAGTEPLMMAFALGRKAELTSSEFQDYWLTKHGPLGSTNPHLGRYRQDHVDPYLTGKVREALGFAGPEFEGAAIVDWADEATLLAGIGDAELLAPILEDEKRFIDHSKSAMVVGRSPEDVIA